MTTYRDSSHFQRGVMEMILEWIQKILSQRLNRKKQDVIRLRWEQAQLQKRVEDLKQAGKGIYS